MGFLYSPSPIPKNNLGGVYRQFFPSFNIEQGGEKGDQQDIFEKVALFHRGTYELQEITNAASLCQEGLFNNL